jgi:hypothetical protein
MPVSSRSPDVRRTISLRMELTGMKATVEQLRREYAFSKLRACRLIGLAVSTYRYQQRRNDTQLRES